MANTYTYAGSIIRIKTTDVSNDAIYCKLDGKKEVPSVAVYGSASPRTAAGNEEWTGEFQVVYDYATSSSTGYRILLTEWETPTVGGLGCIFKPSGEGSGEEEWTFYAVLETFKDIGEEAGNIQKRTFGFKVNGKPTRAAQTT